MRKEEGLGSMWEMSIRGLAVQWGEFAVLYRGFMQARVGREMQLRCSIRWGVRVS